MTSLSDAEMLEDLKSSRRALERKLGHRAPWLAYPFGAYDERVERLTRRAGYLLAVTTRPGAGQWRVIRSPSLACGSSTRRASAG
jgi:peptidoglycan/xylan/chitin deacetylase (PgdA/CDA1 family)